MTIARVAVLWLYLAGVVAFLVGLAVRGAETGKLSDPMWLAAGLLLVAGWPIAVAVVLATATHPDRHPR